MKVNVTDWDTTPRNTEMRIAVLGATSHIANDFIISCSYHTSYDLVLFARRPEIVAQTLKNASLSERYAVYDFCAFRVDQHFDAIINFIGSGNPVRTGEIGASILDVTLKYDDLVLQYLHRNPACRYIFLSSGAAYGARFHEPVDEETSAAVAINNLQPQDWYAVAKLYAECRHRAHPELAIIDIRIFNYFSRTQDISARFLITDIVRAVRDKKVLLTSRDNIVRDFLHPADFYSLIRALLTAPAVNAVADCYTRAPVDKKTLLAAMEKQFGLQYEITDAAHTINATGAKAHYYSLSRRAADFGYHPMYTSLQGVMRESEAVLEQSA